jgi:phage tail sheath gpL-like
MLHLLHVQGPAHDTVAAVLVASAGAAGDADADAGAMIWRLLRVCWLKTSALPERVLEAAAGAVLCTLSCLPSDTIES